MDPETLSQTKRPARSNLGNARRGEHHRAKPGTGGPATAVNCHMSWQRLIHATLDDAHSTVSVLGQTEAALRATALGDPSVGVEMRRFFRLRACRAAQAVNSTRSRLWPSSNGIDERMLTRSEQEAH